MGAHSQFNSWIGQPLVAGTAEEIAQGLDASAWQRLSAGSGTKGARLHDWACRELADLDADAFNPTLPGTWTRGLLVRRNLADGERAYFTTWCPAGTDIAPPVAVDGQRWAIEDSFETAKTAPGLDHNETRSWHGWHRHASLVMRAFAMMASVRHHANPAEPRSGSRAPAPQKTPQRRPRLPQRSFAGPSRTFAASPPAWPSAPSSLPVPSHGRSGEERTKLSHNAAT